MKKLIGFLFLCSLAFAQYPSPPLPSNASKETGGNLESINSKLSNSITGLKIDGTGYTQSVSGNFSIGGSIKIDGSDYTQSISAKTLPLPTGAALDSTLSTINSTLGTPFQSGGLIGNTTFVASQPTGSNLHTNVDNFPSSQAVTGTFFQSTQPVSISGTVNTNGSAFTQSISAAALPLPSGAATAARQDTGNTSISSIDTKFPSKGQTTMALSVPVTIASDQSSFSNFSDYTALDQQLNAVSQSVQINSNGSSNVTVVLTGTWVATLNAQGSIDGSTWTSLTGFNTESYASAGPLLTISNDAYYFPIAGFQKFRIICTGYTSGTIIVSMAASNGSNINIGSVATNFVDVVNPLTVSGTVTANSGSNLNTSLLALDTSVTGLSLSQASTTASEKGILTQAATSRNPPTYSDAKTNPISNTLRGGLRIDGSDYTQSVSGTFWQTTQPIQISSSAITLPMAYAGASTMPVSMTILPSGTNLIGSVSQVSTWKVDASAVTQPVSIAGTVTITDASMGTTTSTAPTSAVLAGGVFNTTPQTLTNNKMGSLQLDSIQNLKVTGPTLTKSTQSTSGFSVQDLKDAGRNNVSFYAINWFSGANNTESTITLTKSSGFNGNVTGTSFACTSGKNYRITAMSFGIKGNAIATADNTTFCFRVNPSGAINTSSICAISALSGAPATASTIDRVVLPLPDGYELSCDGTLQFGVTANSSYTTNPPTLDVLITGYEY